MRHDMYKVIVERPRRGGKYSTERPAPLDLENSPNHEGLRRRHRNRKWLNENLAPLHRYLASQVGRPWDKVYAGICAGIDRRNTVQQHIHEHLDHCVETHVHEIDGVLYGHRNWGGLVPLASTSARDLYVDPVHGILKYNNAKRIARRQHDQDRQATLTAQRTGHTDTRRILDARTQLHRIEGLWYVVELAPTAGNNDAIDAIRHLPVKLCPQWSDGKHCPSNLSLFNTHDRYACGKRQLSARELRQHGLRNAP